MMPTRSMTSPASLKRGVRIARLLPLAILLLAGPATAEPPPEAQRPPAVLSALDGDSILVDGVEWRLLGLDAPEIDRARCEGERRTGILAKRRLQALITSGQPLRLRDSGRRDKYKRPLGDLWIGDRLARDILIAELYARPYNGGRKKGWCSRDSRDDLIPGPPPSREMQRPPDSELLPAKPKGD